MQLTTDGIVLSDYKSGEDRILTILTREHGVLTAFANGANRFNPKLAASTELFCFSSFVIFSNRGRNVVNSADSLRIFFGIRNDLKKLALASYFTELTKELAPRKERAQEWLSLLLNCLYFIENEKRDECLLKPLIELRVLTLSGYMPQLVCCRECSCFSGDEMFFFPRYGELLCGNCALEEEKRSGILVKPGALSAVRHIIYAPPDKLFNFTLSPEGLFLLGELSEVYLLTQIEKSFPTLEFYKSIRDS